MRIALVTIAKSEDFYIDEWLQYHFALGFTDAFIYQNNWRYKGDKSQYGDKVNWIEFDIDKVQLPAYNDFINTKSDNIDFAAFIDVDEFVCLNKDKSMEDFLSRYTNCCAIGLNWKLFGDAGLKFDGRRTVLDRFTKCQHGLNMHIKTILNMKLCGKRFHFINPHFIDGASLRNTTVDVDQTRHIHGPFNPNCLTQTAWLNHYHNKTEHEWHEKMERGRPDLPAISKASHYNMQSFYDHNFNDETNTVAMDFWNSAREME